MNNCDREKINEKLIKNVFIQGNKNVFLKIMLTFSIFRTIFENCKKEKWRVRQIIKAEA